MKLLSALILGLVCCAAPGCGAKDQAPGPVTMNDQELETWQIALVELRIDKNEAFRDTTESPLRAQDIPGFEGLNYYDPNPEFVFRVPLVREARPDTVVLVKRRGQQVPYVKIGKVTFKAQKKPVTLWVLGSTDPRGQGSLWLPFYDETSGRETYGGGRYLDLQLGADGRTLEIDFNRAYNPLCDYNPDKWNCTLPPKENRVPLAVTAGEKLLRPGGH